MMGSMGCKLTLWVLKLRLALEWKNCVGIAKCVKCGRRLRSTIPIVESAKSDLQWRKDAISCTILVANPRSTPWEWLRPRPIGKCQLVMDRLSSANPRARQADAKVSRVHFFFSSSSPFFFILFFFSCACPRISILTAWKRAYKRRYLLFLPRYTFSSTFNLTSFSFLFSFSFFFVKEDLLKKGRVEERRKKIS